MYSKNDYRYYLENQLIHSDDYLAHYGVKGMKWKNHKKQVNADDLALDVSYGASNAALIAYKVKDKVKDKPKQKGSSEYNQEVSYNSKKNNFPKSTVSSTKKKKTPIKKRISNIRKKYGLYREKPKGKKLKGGGNIYVSHS